MGKEIEYSKEVAKSIDISKDIAKSINSKTIRSEHLFLANLQKRDDRGNWINDEESDIYQLLNDMQLNVDAIRQTLM